MNIEAVIEKLVCATRCHTNASPVLVGEAIEMLKAVGHEQKIAIKQLTADFESIEKSDTVKTFDEEKCRAEYERRYFKSHFVFWNGSGYEIKAGYEEFAQQAVLVNNGWIYWRDACKWQSENNYLPTNC